MKVLDYQRIKLWKTKSILLPARTENLIEV